MTQMRVTAGPLAVEEQSIVPTVLGVLPLVAVGAEAGATVIGVLVDLLRLGSLGTIFTILYIGGCVLAVAWVRRGALFGPMVAPPLLLAVAVPAVVVLAGSPKPGAGMAQRLLVVGAPLVNAFPTMAWATGIVLVVGVFRIVTQRRPRLDPGVRAVDRVAARSASRRGGAQVRPERDATRAAARRSESPRRS